MKYLAYLYAGVLFFSGCTQKADIDDSISFSQVDPLSKVLKESSYFPEYNVQEEVARGEHATFQFVIRSSQNIHDLKVEVSTFKNQQGDTLPTVHAGFVDYVRVGRQTPDRAKDALTPVSQYYPDPVISKDTWQVDRDQSQPIWLNAEVPHSATPGVYQAKVSLKGKAGSDPFLFEKEISLKVYPVTLEKPTLWVANWFSLSLERMKMWNGRQAVEPYSERYWELVKELADRLKDCYSNVILLSPLEHVEFSVQEGNYSFDFTHFDRLISLFREKGVLGLIEGGHIAGRSGNWDSSFEPYVPEWKDGRKILKQYPMNSPEAQNFYKQFIPALMKHLEKMQLDKMYVQHIADEPIESNISSYVEIARFVKSLAPNIRIIEACHSHNLQNTLDIWVPQLNFYKDGYDFYCDRREQGDEVWFYTCLAPQGDFVNRFLEQPLIKTRLIHWLNFKYGATGYLHWGFNQWFTDGDPYGETTTMNTESGNTLPGGDSWIVYPDNGKLYGSIRLDAMRDGIADYTLLSMLQKKDPEMAKELCRLVIFNWTIYDTESDHFRKIRKQLLEALSTDNANHAAYSKQEK